jgi:cell division protein FtsW (lipid II flippase)
MQHPKPAKRDRGLEPELPSVKHLPEAQTDFPISLTMEPLGLGIVLILVCVLLVLAYRAFRR